MKTLEQCLEGVTAGGKWIAELYPNGVSGLVGENKAVAMLSSTATIDAHTNAAYAACACSSFPELVRALDLAFTSMARAYDVDVNLKPAINQARAALAEALKD